MHSGAGLATVVLVAVIDASVGAQPARTPVPAGVWGGEGIQLTVTTDGAAVDYGCDSGIVSERLLSDPSGRFSALGTHAFGRGGPREPGDPPRKSHRARYDGRWNGDTLQLTVFLPDLDRKVGDFTVELGRRAALERCG